MLATPMTWGNFKKWVEGQGVQDNDWAEGIICLPDFVHEVIIKEKDGQNIFIICTVENKEKKCLEN